MAIKLPGTILAGIEAVFNRLTREQPDIIDPVLHNKTVRIHFTDLNQSLYFYFVDQRIFILDEIKKEADGCIAGTLTSLASLSITGRAHTRDIRLDGDLQLMQAFEQMLAQIDPDWEEWLSHYTGDVIAFQVGEAARGLQAWGKQAANAFADDLRDYLQIETRQLPPATEVDAFNHAVDDLRAAVERLEQRLKRLQRRVPTENP